MAADTGWGCDDSWNVNIKVNFASIQISAVWQQQNIYANGSIMDQISANDLVKHKSVCVIHKQPYICPDYPQAAVRLLTARCRQISHAQPSNNLAFLWKLFHSRFLLPFMFFFFGKASQRRRISNWPRAFSHPARVNYIRSVTRQEPTRWCAAEAAASVLWIPCCLAMARLGSGPAPALHVLYSPYKWYCEEGCTSSHEWMRGGASTLVGKVPLSGCLFSGVCGG